MRSILIWPVSHGPPEPWNPPENEVNRINTFDNKVTKQKISYSILSSTTDYKNQIKDSEVTDAMQIKLMCQD